MSLFENELYRWRETYFVLFHETTRPSADAVEQALAELGSRYEMDHIRLDDEGRFESVTIYSPTDFAAMDISYISGEEVALQVDELQEDLRAATLTGDDLRKLTQLADFNARFDIYHFEKVVGNSSEGDDFLDPGALLIVLEKLAELCQGVGIDPQTSSLM